MPPIPPEQQSPHGGSQEPASSRSYLSSQDVRRRYGNVSVMSIWRWLHDDKLKFPKPRLCIKGRRYWLEGDLIAWERQRAARSEVVAA
jgi:predicted DNA-binding transcriptional regulator AlpA